MSYENGGSALATCPCCDGTGALRDSGDPCGRCGGSGHLRVENYGFGSVAPCGCIEELSQGDGMSIITIRCAEHR